MKRIITIGICSILVLFGFSPVYAQQSIEKKATEQQAKESCPEMMFVQNAHSGSLTELKDEKGAFILKLEGVYAETIAFSDRPARIVEQISTEKFSKSRLFKDKIAPNAAIEILGADDNADVMVVTLHNPVYDAKTSTMQYLVRPLKDPKHGRAVYNKRHDQSLPASFGPTALFIDNLQGASCRNGAYSCCNHLGPGARTCEYEVITNIPCCWSWSDMECGLCKRVTPDDLDNMCKSKYPQYPHAWDRGHGCAGWN
jgi:hypothetical protein